MADQRFDEQQIGAILQRAAEIQSGLSPEAEAPGVTLNELQKVASEIGIEPSSVAQAAREIQAPTSKTAAYADSRTFDQTMDGALSDEAWEDIVIHLRQFVGRPGAVTVQGNTREWSGDWDVGNMTLTATTRNGKTRFRMLIDTSGGTVMGWVFGIVAALFLTPMTAALLAKNHAGALFVTLGAIFIFSASTLSASLAIRRWRKKARRHASKLFTAIMATAQTPGPPVESSHETGTDALQVQA